MSFNKLLAATVAVAVTTGCASGLSSLEENRYSAYRAEGVLIEEKNPTTGAVLGILPGFGSFYAREPVYGVANLLLWPLSVLWDPVSGYEGSKSINYAATAQKLEREKEIKLAILTEKLESGTIDQKTYLIKKSKIEADYNY